MLFADPGRDPDFVCVGTQRAGTTWLAVALGKHPHVWMPPFKELSFWHPESESVRAQVPRMVAAVQHQAETGRVNLPSLRWWSTLALAEVRDRAWYRSLFAPAGDRVTGDVTPQYALLDDARAAEVGAALPDARFVLLLRHPVERAWSQLRLDQRLGRVDLSAPRDVLAPQLKRLLVHAFSEQGRLHARWRAAVGEARLLVVFHDEIQETPGRAFVRVCDHLGLATPSHASLSALGQRINAAPGGEMPGWLRADLSRRYLPDTRELARRFPHPVGGWAAEMEGWAAG